VSEQPTAGAARPPKAPGKTYAGLTRNQWFIVGGVFVAALGYILWRRHQASAAAASGTAPTNQGSNECTDANGNPVDCNELFAQELAALQNSLDQLGAQSGGGSSGGGGTAGGNGTTPSVPDTVTGAPATTQPPATPTSSGGTTGTRIERRAGAVTGLAATAVTRTSFKATWRAAANATGGYAYIVRDLASHTEVKSGTTRSTSVTVSGLKPGTDYNFGVQGLPGGPGDNIHVRTK
jgi:hypothetical protein